MDGESAKDRELDSRRLKREEPVALQQPAPEAQNLIIPTPGRGEVLKCSNFAIILDRLP